MSTLRRIATLALVLALGTLAAGCGAESRRARLTAAAESLLLPDARIVSREFGVCVELAPDPSCLSVYTKMQPKRAQERYRAWRKQAAAAGWRIRSAEKLVGGWFVRLTKEGLRASVSFASFPCGHAGCRDLTHVVLE